MHGMKQQNSFDGHLMSDSDVLKQDAMYPPTIDFSSSNTREERITTVEVARPAPQIRRFGGIALVDRSALSQQIGTFNAEFIVKL